MATISKARIIPAKGAKRRPRSRHAIMHSIAAHGALIILSCLFAAPFLWLVTTSLKQNRQIFTFPPVWIPRPVILEHYRVGLSFIPFLLYLKNTLTYCILATIGAVGSSSLVAYGLARIRWPGRGLLFALIVGTMIVPSQVTLIPLFIVFKQLGWLDSLKPLIVPHFLGLPFYIFLLRQYFMTIPQELSEAAKIDGASEWQIYRKVVLPLAKPVLATVALFTFLHAWNDFLGPLIFLNSEEKYTLSIGLAMFRGQYTTLWGPMMAASTVMTVPVIAVFFFAQRTFIQGITLTGIKG